MDLKQNNHKNYSKDINYKIDENSLLIRKKGVFFNFWERFFKFSLLFHCIPFSDHFLRYLGITRHFFIKLVRKYEFFTVVGGLIPVGSKIVLVEKFFKNSQLFCLPNGSFLGSQPTNQRNFIFFEPL